MEVTIDGIKTSIEKLSLKEGDVVLLRYPYPLRIEGQSSLIQIAEAIQETQKGIVVICLSDGHEIETLDEKEMNAAGWFRKPAA